MSNTITIAGREWPIDNGRAYLRGASLRGAELRGACLEGAYLERADLERADLERADLRDANLRDTYLQGASLQGASLEGASLEGAYLQGANLQGASLEGANLQGANLQGANGVYELDMIDLRGYRPVAVAHTDGWRISSGCRWFTVKEALAHWSNPEHEAPGIAARYIRAVNALPECPNVEARK